MNMTTMQMLAMQYGFRALIPLDMIANDYLSGLTKTELHRKAKNQQLGFACVNTGSDKRPKYLVPVENLAIWIDSIKKEAVLDHQAMHA